MTRDAIGRLRRLDSCVVSDALDRLSLEGALGAFRRWGRGGVVAGRVTTVALRAGSAPKVGAHLGVGALAAAGPDHVIVVANQGRTEAGAWGGLLTLRAHLLGVAGVIVDGALRDIDEVEALDVAVFARAATPRTARGRFHEVATDAVVRVEGVEVAPGSLVVADGSGVVFVRREDLNAVLPVAEEIAARESTMAKALRAGSQGAEILGSDYELMLERET
ncbi:MAG: RraA family protein [Gemmatimonadota bacterium]